MQISQITKWGILSSVTLPWTRNALSSFPTSQTKSKSHQRRKHHQNYPSVPPPGPHHLSLYHTLIINTISFHGFNHLHLHTWLLETLQASPCGWMDIFSRMAHGPFKFIGTPSVHQLLPWTSTPHHLCVNSSTTQLPRSKQQDLFLFVCFSYFLAHKVFWQILSVFSMMPFHAVLPLHFSPVKPQCPSLNHCCISKWSPCLSPPSQATTLLLLDEKSCTLTLHMSLCSKTVQNLLLPTGPSPILLYSFQVSRVWPCDLITVPSQFLFLCPICPNAYHPHQLDLWVSHLPPEAFLFWTQWPGSLGFSYVSSYLSQFTQRLLLSWPQFPKFYLSCLLSTFPR